MTYTLYKETHPEQKRSASGKILFLRTGLSQDQRASESTSLFVHGKQSY